MNKNKDKRILVIGSRGYLGPHVVQFLREADYGVVEVDALLWGQEPMPGVEVRDASTKDFTGWVKDLQPDAIVYLGAVAHDPEGLVPPDQHIRHTFLGPVRVARAMPDIPFIFSSSLSVFSTTDDQYPSLKASVETELLRRRFTKTHILRFGTLFGPGVTPEYYRPHLLLNSMVYDGIKKGLVTVRNDYMSRPVLDVRVAANWILHTLNWSWKEPGRTTENYYSTCGRIRQYGEVVAGILQVPLVSGLSEDKRNYGWGEFQSSRLYIPIRELVNWTREHLNEIDTEKKQVFP